MIVTCPDCGDIYDDARKLTFCPHDGFLSTMDLKQKSAALELCGKTVRFAHQRDTGPDHHVLSVSWNGMITLRDMADYGEFAPSLFVTAP
jgi:hypothetical protein